MTLTSAIVLLTMMGFGGSYEPVRTRSWNAGIISEPVLTFCYRQYTFVVKMREPVNSKYNSKENLFLKF